MRFLTTMLRARSRTTALAALALAPLATLAAGPRAAHAQQEARSVFSALDSQGRRVAVGEEVSGSLGAADLLGTEGRFQVWVLGAAPGSRVRVDLRSGEFDAFLRVVGPGLGSGLTDDDGGPGLDARVCLEIPDGGETRVVASALSDGMGPFRLAVSEAAADACEADEEASDLGDPAALPVQGVLQAGETVQGVLSEADGRLYGSYAQAWTLTGVPGAEVTVDLRSQEFDSYLSVLGPGLETLTDDDGAGRCDARVTFTPPEAGEYRIVVSTLGAGTGSFTLSASEEPGALAEGTCLGTSTDAGPTLDEVPVLGSLGLEGGVDGTLTGSETLFRGSPVQAWTLEGRAGERIAITVVSEEMDSYLWFDGPGFGEPLRDDDGAGGLNSLLCVELPEDGTYRVFPGRLSEDGPGTLYRLEVTAASAAEYCTEYRLGEARMAEAFLALGTAGEVEVGQTVDGTLADGDARHPSNGTLVQAWRLIASPGATVWVDLLSEDFDPLLRVLGPSLPLVESDDYSEGWNSRLEVVVPVDGEVLVLAGAYAPSGAGAFRLRVSLDPPPLEVNSGGGGGEASVGNRVDPDLLRGLDVDPGRVLVIGEEIEGELTEDDPVLGDERRARAWTFHGEAGDVVAFEADGEELDPAVYVAGPGIGDPLMDDDAGAGLSARLVLTLPETGTYTVVVGALSGGTGQFLLRVVRRTPS